MARPTRAPCGRPQINLRWDDFQQTDNSCRAAETTAEEIKNDLGFVESKVATGLASTERGFLDALVKDVRLLETELEMIEGAVGREVVEIETEIVKEEQAVVGFVKGLFGSKEPAAASR